MSVRKVQGSDNALRGQEQGAGQARQAEGHHGGHSYKVGQQRSQGAARQGARKTPLTRRRPPRRGASSMQQADMQDQQQELHDGGMDDQQRPFDPFASMQKDAGADNPQSGQQHRFGQTGQPPRKMQYKLAAVAGDDGVPRRMIELGLPGAAQLFGPEPASRPAPLDLAGALSAVVLAGVKRKCTVRAEPFRLSRLVLNAALAQLMRQGEAAWTLTLGDVKNLLILRQREAWGGWSLPAGEAEAIGDTLALLPLVALNAARPRTRSQRQAAIDRQRLVLRSRGV